VPNRARASLGTDAEWTACVIFPVAYHADISACGRTIGAISGLSDRKVDRGFRFVAKRRKIRVEEELSLNVDYYLVPIPGAS